MGLRITRRRVLDVGFLFHGHHSLTSERRREDAFGPRIACSVRSQFCEAVGSASFMSCGSEQKTEARLAKPRGIACRERAVLPEPIHESRRGVEASGIL
jgi:hypothetical protein